MSLHVGEEFVDRTLQPALSSPLTLPMPLKRAVILIGSYKIFGIKHNIKKDFCLWCQGIQVLLSPIEVFKHSESGSLTLCTLRVASRKRSIFAVFPNGMLHERAEYCFHQEAELLLVSLNQFASGSSSFGSYIRI